jgi:hypothetical protein
MRCIDPIYPKSGVKQSFTPDFSYSFHNFRLAATANFFAYCGGHFHWKWSSCDWAWLTGAADPTTSDHQKLIEVAIVAGDAIIPGNFHALGAQSSCIVIKFG